MEKLTDSFTISALANFFKNAILSFKNDEENLNHIFEGKEFPEFSDLIKIGSVEFKNTDELIVFACKFRGLLTERSSKKKQFEIAKLVLKDDFKDGAIFVFYDEEGKFRFSFIKRNWDGKGEQKYSAWKRFTYFVDPKQTNKTFKNRIGNCSFKNLESIQEAFSVEKLTKEFYNDLFKWYQWVLSEEIGITYPNNTDTSDDDRVKLEEQVIRLITRLLFVWFIKQKHLVPDELFKTVELSKVLKDFDPDSKTDGNYYNAILQNLFFATLNKAIDERDFAKLKTRDIKTLYRYAEMFNISEDEILELFRPIPFLNGGLFECLDKEDVDGKKYFLDGYSRNDKRAANGNLKHRAFIPNCVFFDEKDGIIPLLERYNFTVEENAPNEVQVALDPELLGNVFENLLGAFNDETKETARKQSGSFYTPREIVSYMVDESLIAYVINALSNININENTIRQLFAEEELPIELANNHALCEEIASKLRTIKILDPACGSGAFPMGILNRMVEILDKLDARDEKTIYDQKLHLIEECIYGIDLQTIATQISKLRFFISLIVEQDGMDLSKPDENYNVITLPNLETKFVAANTLIGIKRKPAQGNLFENPEIETTKQELLAIRKEHFYAKTANRKKTLREKDAELREKLSQLLQEDNEFAPEDAVQFSKWNPYDQNSSSPFFDPEWMFGIEEGFDTVIGNPPYVQLQKESGRLAKMYQHCGYKTFTKTGDIYSLFYERGWQLLKDKGILCYITSNKWMRAGYGESTRKFFAEQTNPILLIDFAGQKIFESATVDTNILLFSRDKNRQQTQACIIKEKVLNNLSDYFRQNANSTEFLSSESWVILSPIEKQIKEKIERIGTPLKDWDIRINYGIKTGFNDAFIINETERKELIEQDPKSEEIIRPILRGRDIKRYSYEESNRWLINVHNGIKEKNIKPIDIDDYPAIKKYLDQFLPELEKRTDKGNTPYNLRNCAYMEDFSKQKIIYPNMTKYLPFFLDDTGFYTNQKCFIITGEKLAYLTAFFNSNVFKICYRDSFPELQGGTRELSKIFFEKLKIPHIENLISEDFDILVKDVQDGKDFADLRLERALLLALDLQDHEEYILNYKI